MLKIENLSRRDFIKSAAVSGGAFVLGAKLTASRKAFAAAPVLPGSFEPNVFIKLAKDGTVTLLAHRSEMGQGSRTGLPQIMADELEADWGRVVIEQAEGDVDKYGDQNTDGSASVVKNFDRMREFGAAARTMLEQAAAQKWGADASLCHARNHQVVNDKTGEALDFGELAEIASKLEVPAAESVKLKDRKDWRYIGKPMPIYDLHDMTRGAAVYGIDVTMPGMKHASIERPPVLLGKVRSYDASAALAVPGVEQVVQLPVPKEPLGFQALGGLAVIASNTWAAMEGRKKLTVEWEDGANRVYDSAGYRKTLEAATKQPGDIRRMEGDIEAAFKGDGKTLEATYYSPHFVHAPMEVPVAVANVSDGKCEVWACCQNAPALRATAAAAIGMDEANVTARVTLLGGAFGRKSKPDFGAEAAIVSKAIGAPVKVTWTREDDVRNGYYHAAAAQYVRAALDDKGRPKAWHHRTVFPPIMSLFQPGQRKPGTWELDFGLTDLPYDVPSICIESGEADVHVRIGWKRSVQNIFHAFAVNSFTGELAAAAGRDHLDYLLELIGPARHIDLTQGGVTDYFNYGSPIERYPIDTGRLANVLKIAADKAGWGKSLPARRGMGLAVHRSFLTYVATVIEVEVSKEGKLAIPRIVMAVDPGTVVNPDRVTAQMEGACIYGMSAAVFGEITAKAGRVQQSNFHDYQVARMTDAPKEIEVHIVESTAPPGGVGEPGVPPFAPALCNAVFAATGKRIRALPIAQHDLSEA